MKESGQDNDYVCGTIFDLWREPSRLPQTQEIPKSLWEFIEASFQLYQEDYATNLAALIFNISLNKNPMKKTDNDSVVQCKNDAEDKSNEKNSENHAIFFTNLFQDLYSRKVGIEEIAHTNKTISTLSNNAKKTFGLENILNKDSIEPIQSSVRKFKSDIVPWFERTFLIQDLVPMKMKVILILHVINQLK
ncbi:hypothetical protein HHI36_013960 [Cryptolaemus montrouzieri]|uniref:Uncharacterized protein n=1 Tax=Cryptolaemus montrouzieri TaxID=559131 RepID=A0ABD2N1V9_9CUCU